MDDLQKSLGELLVSAGADDDEVPPPQCLSSLDLDGLVQKIGEAQNVIVMAGAGISVSAGIPDFRSPGTGLYDNLQKYDLPTPESIFTIDYFSENPAPFYMLAKELYPGLFAPTPTHYFCRLLHEKGKLLRMFSQNIDSLETLAGLPADKVVAAHGNFDTARVITGPNSGQLVDVDEVRSAVMAGDGPGGWQDLRVKYGGLVKPDIVFFGEDLPARFHTLMAEDFPKCDLLIVMGTSLKVRPFSLLTEMVGDGVPRALWNREPAGVLAPDVVDMARKLKKRAPALAQQLGGFVFEGKWAYRDVFCPGNCDDTARAVASKLGWLDELDAAIAADAAKFPPKPDPKAGAAAIAGAAGAGAGAGDGTAVPAAAAAAAADDQGVAGLETAGHASGVWKGSMLVDGMNDPEPFELLLSLMAPAVAQGPISAFGCTWTAPAPGDPEPSYMPLHGKVDFATGKVNLSSCNGLRTFTGKVEVADDNTPTVTGTWGDRITGASGTFGVALAATAAGESAGLWTGDAHPGAEFEADTPTNPIKWCLAHRGAPAGGMPAVFGVGFFDDSGDIPDSPVLFYTLRGTADDASHFTKVYEPPVPELMRVEYTDVVVKRAADGAASLEGKWRNTMELTSGTFTAALCKL